MSAILALPQRAKKHGNGDHDKVITPVMLRREEVLHKARQRARRVTCEAILSLVQPFIHLGHVTRHGRARLTQGKNSRQQDLRAAPAFASLPGGARPRSPGSLRRASGTLDMRSSASDLGKCAPRKSHKPRVESTLHPRGANLVNPTLCAMS